MDDVKVSVYCLAYNHEKYIRKALDGFVNQITNFKYEVIVHDDASTDETAKIIREYEKKYPDIIKPIYQKENQYSKKISILSTFILPKANGQYIASCEGDDYWTDPHKLQKQFEALEAHPECSLCVHRVQCHNEDDSYNKRSIPEDGYGLNEDAILDCNKLIELYYMNGGYPFHTSSYFYRKEILFEKVEIKRDVGILRKCLINGEAIYFDNPMSVRRLFTIGNFNSRLLSGDKQVKINFYMDNIVNEHNFDCYTKKKYHKYVSYSIIMNAIEIGKCDSKKFKKIIKKYNIRFFQSTKVMRFKNRIKLLILYSIIKYCPIVYRIKKKGLRGYEFKQSNK